MKLNHYFFIFFFLFLPKSIWTCSNDQWSCAILGGCISSKKIMDEVIDCVDGSDENACITNRHNCTYSSQCVFTKATNWYCTSCPNGQIGNSISCVADPCDFSSTKCDENAYCTSRWELEDPNNSSSIRAAKSCTCREGYYGSGISCSQGQCGTGAKTCSANAVCWDSSATDSTCVCKPGYTTTSDNQCQSGCTGSNVCDPHATCTTTGSTSSCTCNTGYKGSDLVPLYGGSCKANNAFPDWFNCLDGTCISILQLRDTFQDCSQDEDEACDTESGQIRCDTNMCVNVTSVVDLCGSGQLYDKLYCLYFNMTPYFMCADYSICIPGAWENNGVCNCDDCSDEYTTTSSTTSTTLTTTTVPTTTTTTLTTTTVPTTTTTSTTSTTSTSTTTTQPTTTTSTSTTTLSSTTTTVPTTTSAATTTTLSQSSTEAQSSTTTVLTTTDPTVWVNPFTGSYGTCWETKTLAAKSQLSTDPLCPCVGNRMLSSSGDCEFDDNSYTLKVRSTLFCASGIAWHNDFTNADTTAFSDMAYLVVAGLQDAINNASKGTVIKSVCVPKTAMSQGSVLTDVLVKVDSSSVSAAQAGQALSDSLAGVSGTLGSGLGTQNISDVDECASSTTNECSTYSTCTNTYGSYTCVCNSGYSDKSPTGARSGTVCRKTCSSGWNIGDNHCFPVWALVLLILLALLLLLCCLIACCCWLCNRKRYGKHPSGPTDEMSQQTEADPENGIYPPTDRVLTPVKERKRIHQEDDGMPIMEDEERPLTQADNARSGPMEEKPPSPPGTVPAEDEAELYDEPQVIDEPVIIPPTPEPAVKQKGRRKKRNDVSPAVDDEINNRPPPKTRKRVNANDEAADKGYKTGRSSKKKPVEMDEDVNVNDRARKPARSRSKVDKSRDRSRDQRDPDDRSRDDRSREPRDQDDRSRDDRSREPRDRSRAPRDRSRDPRGEGGRSRDPRDRSSDPNKSQKRDPSRKRDKSRNRQEENTQPEEDMGGDQPTNDESKSLNRSKSKIVKGQQPPTWQPWSGKPGGFSNDSSLLDV